ncbi:MAG: hypothetical protein JWQ74_445 [Marmoricola sp.]|nr:hypothetical protein [Marmoricola sp.]
MAGISRKALLDQTHARLAGVSGLSVYNGEIPGSPPVKMTGGVADPSGRVAPYVVLWPSPGTPTREGRDLADTHQDLDWLIQLHVVAGYLEDLIFAVDQVDARLHNWAPTIDDVGFNGLRPPAGYDPGPSRRNDSVDPPRHWQPLQYRLTATR